jgi:alkylation response protein AidB-like acyl-CoA dehydrogenase
MRFTPSAEQAELRRAARRYLGTHWASAQVRASVDAGAELPAATWTSIAQELGWPALLVPESSGGAGLGWREACILAEEAGRTLACLPLFSTFLATGVLRGCTEGAARSGLLSSMASGETRGALAYAEGADVDALRVATTASSSGSGWVLRGEKRFVVDGASADVLIVSARTPETSGVEGLALYVVPRRAPGVVVRRTPTLDATRQLAHVALQDVQVDADARIGDSVALQRGLDRASITLAAEALGGAEQCLEMAVAYAKTRTQFDRPIGSFQAIKHKLADLFTAVETTRSAVLYAADAADGADDAEAAIAAAVAKSHATEAFFRCAAENIQIHGGVGFTWEHDAHLFLKRARGSLVLLGTAARDRERVAGAIGLGPSGVA